MAKAATARVAERGPGPSKAAGLTPETMREMYRAMLQARMVDERCWLLNRGGKAPFVISCQGQEAAGVGTVFALDRTQDWFAPYYRDLAVVLALGMTPVDIFRSVMARAGDPNSGARQMPSHFGSRKLRIISQGSSVATQCLHSVGAALATKVRGEGAVSINYVGEGGTSQGDFHEALNFASVHKLPVIFVVENNHYAISVPLDLQMAVPDVALRAQGYGMPGVVVDGQDVVSVYKVTRQAADRARAGEGPTLIEAKTHRFTSHSSDDDQRVYRDLDQLRAEHEDDPITRFRDQLAREQILSEAQEAAIRAELKQEIDVATQEAEDSPYPDAAEIFDHVYGEGGPSREELSGMPRLTFGEGGA
jgi:2-oxoisovalerate dehydrogenase E1 component alpha subunit